MNYLFDTHVWIWWHMMPQNLSKKVVRTIQNLGPHDELLLSAISPWEFSKLIEKKRLRITISPEEWIDRALDIPHLRLVPLYPLLAYRSTVLPDFAHSDPADQIIVATAREEGAVLITKDRRLTSYEHIKTLW
ncbi:MAG: PilT protein [uncultured bacterium]|nr:MAG: PilT protein [uncultured bacterium]